MTKQKETKEFKELQKIIDSDDDEKTETKNELSEGKMMKTMIQLQVHSVAYCIQSSD
jgi:hypothetical protein